MALTAQVKDELARLAVDRTSYRKAEVSATLRFAGGLHIISGRIVIEAELDTAAAARRLRQAILEVFGHTSDVIVVSPSGLRRQTRYVVRVVRDGESLARQTGLLDARGRPVRGLSPQIVSAGVGRPRPRGAARSSRTARSPSRAARPRSRSRARGPRPRSRSWAPRAGSGSRPRPARCAGSTGS
ncbi:hypothetical protein GCM10025864_38220 [Luteimicrobium album]|uniref:Sporulation transcription regulator WhiA N-terminal domain-containing protein n=1 Tax=Luteimicrobium album TaxID=1054550 RepID=A0ABQ6I7Y5_9MICO|nr:hypothetical protein GCM10025864_38220 [Luteimicrobium album]